ncbi:MAG: hypothetical protein SH818_03690 [Saprospiraceae bacterium]|nr:hypothetical protein [Saprospiraceae bacterium]
MKNKGLLRTIFFTALIAAILDLAGAAINYMISSGGKFPKKILEYIAGGVYGGSALDGSMGMNIKGALLHFLIASIWTILFFSFYPKIKFFHRSIWVNAVVYGLIVWLVMNLIVLPFSAWKAPIVPFKLETAIRAAIVLIICVALPIAMSARKYYNKAALS